MRKTKKSRLYNGNPRGKPVTEGTGYKNENTARKTLKLIRHMPKNYQYQVITTMYYRAKHHKYQTKNMKKAMNVYKEKMEQMNKK